MQPLISPIDHESRHNSYRTEEALDNRLTEDTPLLRRFPTPESTPRNPITTITVTLLLVILLSGGVIGIYLLVLQSKAENVLPPVDMPLQLVGRDQWDLNGSPVESQTPHTANQVIVVQTDSAQCHSTLSCIRLLHTIQNRTEQGNIAPLPYNFLISSNGQTYEALGWHKSSPLFPQHSANSLVLAFIGNFTETPPTRAQMIEARNFFDESVSHQYLSPSFVVVGKNTKESPTRLFSSVEALPQWRGILSD